MGVRGYANGVRDAARRRGGRLADDGALEAGQARSPATRPDPTQLDPHCPAFEVVAQGSPMRRRRPRCSSFKLEQVRHGVPRRPAASRPWRRPGCPRRRSPCCGASRSTRTRFPLLVPGTAAVPHVPAANQILVGVQGPVDPATVSAFVVRRAERAGGRHGSHRGGRRRSQRRLPACRGRVRRQTSAPCVIQASAPFPAGHQIGLFFTNGIHSPDGAPLVASPVSVLLTLTAPLVDSDGHSTVSGVADADAAALEAGAPGLAPLLRQPGLLAADGRHAREPRLLLRLRPDGDAMNKTRASGRSSRPSRWASSRCSARPGRAPLPGQRLPDLRHLGLGDGAGVGRHRRRRRARRRLVQPREPGVHGRRQRVGGRRVPHEQDPASRRPAAGPTPTPTAATSSCRSSSRTRRITDRVAVGMGVYSTFGIGITWPNDWEGRESAIKASLRDADLEPDRRRPRAPADRRGGRVRRGPQRRRLHERPAGDHRRRRAPGRRHLGLRLQRRRALQDLPGPAARGAHLPQPGQARTSTTGRRTSAPPTRTSRRRCPTRAARRPSRCPTSSPSA